MKQLLFLLLLNILINSTSGQILSLGPRHEFTINEGWEFLPEGLAHAEHLPLKQRNWTLVDLPHTWNSDDPFDDDKTYRRGISWYKRELNFGSAYRDKNIFLYFEGAFQVADVYINGAFALRHKGGYTGFSVDITDMITWKDSTSENIISVQVNSAHDPFIPPLSIGYALYGGIYRDVWVIATSDIHFTDINNNASGIKISSPDVSETKASLLIKSGVTNNSTSEKSVEFMNILLDSNQKIVKTKSKTYSLAARSSLDIELKIDDINDPALWSPEQPNLYTLKSQLIVDGQTADEVQNAYGFRWFEFDPVKGFSLNGKSLVLRGTNRHQDMLGKGDALSPADHERDLQMVKDMGANFLRLAHYPQAAYVLDLADKLGLLIWQEVPVINHMTVDDRFVNNSSNMIREMITQGFNHPSVIMWGSMNEILLHSKEGLRIPLHSDTTYLSHVRRLSHTLDSIVRTEDTTRYSTLAMHMSRDYTNNKLDRIAQVSGYNIYSGWYSGKVEDLGKTLDRMHQSDPKKIIFISEYGAEGDLQLNSNNPIRMDYTPQYQRYYNESYLKQFRERPYLAGTAIWNQFDFSQPNIGGPTPHRNQKGMVTWDRKPKDVYYLYKANWNPEPMIHIASRDWPIRAGAKDNSHNIDIYSNLSSVSLEINGKKYGSKNPDDIKKCSWDIKLQQGENHITVTGISNGQKITDHFKIEYRVYPTQLDKDFQFLSVNVGSNAQYRDGADHIWIEDRPYTNGSYGHISGSPAMFNRKEVIMGTNDVPMYYTWQDSIAGYRFDVPNGQYSLTLCFVENQPEQPGERIFDVGVNNSIILKDFDLANTSGFARAVKKTFIVNAEDGKGIQINFNAKKGKAVLSGIQVRKVL